MSRENVEVVQAAFAAWRAGDMAAFAEVFARDVVLHAPEGWPEPGPEVGRDAAMRQFERLRDAWDAEEVKLVGDFVAADDRVLSRVIWRVVGRHGAESAMEITMMWTVRRGEVSSIEYFWDHADALEAVGLRE